MRRIDLYASLWGGRRVQGVHASTSRTPFSTVGMNWPRIALPRTSSFPSFTASSPL